MAQSVIYIDRVGMLITAEAWKAKQSDESYTIVRQYDNGAVRLVLKWVGRVANPAQVFSAYYKVFVLLVQNYRSDGTLVNDPVDGDKTFPDEAAAIEGYEEFLLKWTSCESDEAGEFIEQDNDLTPPPPPDPNKPATVSDELGDGGAW